MRITPVAKSCFGLYFTFRSGLEIKPLKVYSQTFVIIRSMFCHIALFKNHLTPLTFDLWLHVNEPTRHKVIN